MTSLGAVLEQFPDGVIIYITDPRTGIQRRSKWPPTISEVIEAGEDHIRYLEKLQRPRAVRAEPLISPRLQDRPAGDGANIFVPEGHSRYAKMVEWSEGADRFWWKYGQSSDGRRGIWVSLDAWEKGTARGTNS